MDKRIFLSAVTAVGFLLMAGCTPESMKAPETKVEPPKQPAEPPQPIAGLSAFSAMYNPARAWAADALPLTLASGEVPGVKNDGGKAGMWTAVFVSPSRREARTIFYSVADSGSAIHKGVSVGGAQGWSGATPKSRPFGAGEFVVNSDEAFTAAMEKAGPWVKKHPDKKPTMHLASTARFPTATWYIMWGDNKSGYLAWVNATTGKVTAGK